LADFNIVEDNFGNRANCATGDVYDYDWTVGLADFNAVENEFSSTGFGRDY
jgi:hypothetical protein